MAKLITPTQQMLLDIYEAADQTADLTKLQKKADEMFPDANLKIYTNPGAGRGFMDEEGNLRKDVLCTIGSGPACVAAFKNGDIEAY